MQKSASPGATSPATMAMMAARRPSISWGAVLLTFFVRHPIRIANPEIRPSLSPAMRGYPSCVVFAAKKRGQP